MPKKGVSKSDKLKRTIEYLYEKREPFMLKDLERDLPKAKGIIAQVCGCVFTAPCPLSLPVCPFIQHVFVQSIPIHFCVCMCVPLVLLVVDWWVLAIIFVCQRK
jgi:hypothetical protein